MGQATTLGVLLRKYTSWQGTPGELYLKNPVTGQLEKFSKSLELPWVNNQLGKSCIPSGVYDCEVTWSPKYKRTMYLLRNTDPRTGIRIHSASFAGSLDHGYKCHLLGCIALGSRFIGGPGTDQQLLLSGSRVKMREFRNLTQDKNFKLIIAGDFPCPE